MAESEKKNSLEETVKTTTEYEDKTKDDSVLKDNEKSTCESMENISSRFIYEPTSGLYYDKDTGYYYNAEYGLYYDGNTGCYYSYNKDNKYEIVSKLETRNEEVEKTNDIIDDNKEAKTPYKNNNQIEDSNHSLEDGELSDDSSKNTYKDTASFIKEIRDAAESAQLSNGFVYEPISGLFYDQNSGYYYNAECGLFYDGNTGSYYKINQSTNEYELYSQGQISNEYHEQIQSEKCPQKRKSHEENNKTDIEEDDDNKDNNFDEIEIEEGEIYSNDENLCDNQSYYNTNKTNVNDLRNNSDTESQYRDVSERYPPSLRLIVQETDSIKIRVGTLFIVTYQGGTLGREGKKHDVIIPDNNVSKYHLKFMYNEKRKNYECIDLGSRNGTLLNGLRMSSAKQESEPFYIRHGSVIQISQTKLLCHIHSGNNTCDECEPGCVMMKNIESNNIAYNKEHRNHKEQLKMLKKRFGINEKNKKVSASNNYKDRAEERRKESGSSNDYEKTQMASTETEISKDNKGFKMLEKMGWKKGKVLTENKPINPKSNFGTTGFGYNLTDIEMHTTFSNNKNSEQNKKWMKAQERYKNLPEAI